MENLDSICCDATCYESAIHYPTDIKLLWEATSWNYKQLQCLSKHLGQRMVRTKMVKWTKRYTNYSKSKRPSRKEKRALRRGLLKLLAKVQKGLEELENTPGLKLSAKYWKRRNPSEEVLGQQWAYFFDEQKIVLLIDGLGLGLRRKYIS